MGSARWSPGGWWGGATSSCTVGAYSWPGERVELGYLWWRRVFPSTLHSCPHVGAFVFFFIFLFFWSIDRIICSNNHFSVTAGKVAFQPIFIGLLERQTMVLNWWTLHYLMLGDHGMNFAEYSFHFKLCHKFFNGLWTRPKHQPTRRYKFCSQMQQLITPSSDRN